MFEVVKVEKVGGRVGYLVVLFSWEKRQRVRKRTWCCKSVSSQIFQPEERLPLGYKWSKDGGQEEALKCTGMCLGHLWELGLEVSIDRWPSISKWGCAETVRLCWGLSESQDRLSLGIRMVRVTWERVSLIWSGEPFKLILSLSSKLFVSIKNCWFLRSLPESPGLWVWTSWNHRL